MLDLANALPGSIQQSALRHRHFLTVESPKSGYNHPMSSPDPWILSHETGEPFTHCIHCRLPLHELDSPWLINKDFHKGECVMEYAICQRCRDEVSQQLSTESKQAVREFLEQEIPWQERISSLIMNPDPGTRYESCIACEIPRDQCKGFATSTQFDERGDLMLGALPLMMCDNCTAKITERLSQASRDAWDRFLSDHFDCPPHQSKLPGWL